MKGNYDQWLRIFFSSLPANLAFDFFFSLLVLTNAFCCWGNSTNDDVVVSGLHKNQRSLRKKEGMVCAFPQLSHIVRCVFFVERQQISVDRYRNESRAFRIIFSTFKQLLRPLTKLTATKKCFFFLSTPLPRLKSKFHICKPPDVRWVFLVVLSRFYPAVQFPIFGA